MRAPVERIIPAIFFITHTHTSTVVFAVSAVFRNVISAIHPFYHHHVSYIYTIHISTCSQFQQVVLLYLRLLCWYTTQRCRNPSTKQTPLCTCNSENLNASHYAAWHLTELVTSLHHPSNGRTSPTWITIILWSSSMDDIVVTSISGDR
jgi:hypothetical protein